MKRLIFIIHQKGAKYTRGKKWFLAYKKSYNSKSKALKGISSQKTKKKGEIKLNFNLKMKFLFFYLIRKISHLYTQEQSRCLLTL